MELPLKKADKVHLAIASEEKVCKKVTPIIFCLSKECIYITVEGEKFWIRTLKKYFQTRVNNRDVHIRSG